MYKYSFVWLCVCFSFQVLLGIAGLDESELDETDLHCLKQLNIDKSVVLNSYDENDFIIEGNPKMNEFYACAWQKDGLQNEDGSINVVNLHNMVELKLKKMFPDHNSYRKHVAVESIKNCTNLKGSNDGDTCSKVYNCILKNVGDITQRTKPEDIQD